VNIGSNVFGERAAAATAKGIFFKTFVFIETLASKFMGRYKLHDGF
jgi:hypothetical protein